MALRDDRAGETLAPIVVVAFAARQVQLTLAAVKQFAALFEKGLLRAARLCGDRQAARLMRDKRGQSQQLGAFPGEAFGLLMLGAAAVDPLLQIDRAASAASKAG